MQVSAVLYWFYDGFIGFVCGFLPPPHHHVKAKPTLMPLIENEKTHVLATWNAFLGLEGPVLSSLTSTDNGPK